MLKMEEWGRATPVSKARYCANAFDVRNNCGYAR
jgi:hypothetical protein